MNKDKKPKLRIEQFILNGRKKQMNKIIDEESKVKMSPVPPDPVVTKLDKIIELLENLKFEIRNLVEKK